jgi:hypothetical protein
MKVQRWSDWEFKMRYPMSRRRKITATIVLPLTFIVLVSWTPAPELQGRLHARFDLALGHYKVLGVGLPGPERPEFIRLLHERYGVEFDKVADCLVYPELLAYVKSYNSVSMAAANRKFGHDVFTETYHEADEKWEREQAVSRAQEK